ncbi:hypothetical protein BH09ACT12_BH09ACT12_16090 [soil metagenome]
MTAHTAYSVDLDQLADTVAGLVRCQEACDEALDDVVRQIARLHGSWEGQAAAAQAEAQERWESGFATMRDGLATMRSAADTAHGNYRAAIDANLAMWETL